MILNDRNALDYKKINLYLFVDRLVVYIHTCRNERDPYKLQSAAKR